MATKFSVITPSFNQGRFLEDCLASVRTQAGVEVEHIVVDAGSTDETLEVLGRHSDVRWTSEGDKGMSDGINKGFRRATGDWLMWLNCDDYLLPGALARVRDFISSHPAAEVVHGDCLFVDEKKNLIRRKLDFPVTERLLLFGGCFIPSTSAFYHRKIIDAGHYLNLNYRVCMDWEFYLRLLRERYVFAYLPEALAGFRWHGENTSVIHSGRGQEESVLLQREHIRLQGLSQFWERRGVLSAMHGLAMLEKLRRRFVTHRRLR